MITILHTQDRPRGERRIRVIPTLLIDGKGRLVKSVKFGKRTYIGDPINAVRIFNEKQVDELILLDIDASLEGREPNYDLIADIVSEAFMPVAYGGGVSDTSHISQLYQAGIEKVILSTALQRGTELVSAAARRYGAQAVTVCLPVGRKLWGAAKVRVCRGQVSIKGSPASLARAAAEAGAGEILVYSIDRDGTFTGYDLGLLRSVADCVKVPVVACGGARNIEDFALAVREAGCSAVAAGSLFVYQSARRGVLVNYPDRNLIHAAFQARGTMESAI